MSDRSIWSLPRVPMLRTYGQQPSRWYQLASRQAEFAFSAFFSPTRSRTNLSPRRPMSSLGSPSLLSMSPVTSTSTTGCRSAPTSLAQPTVGSRYRKSQGTSRRARSTSMRIRWRSATLSRWRERGSNVRLRQFSPESSRLVAPPVAFVIGSDEVSMGRRLSSTLACCSLITTPGPPKRSARRFFRSLNAHRRWPPLPTRASSTPFSTAGGPSYPQSGITRSLQRPECASAT